MENERFRPHSSMRGMGRSLGEGVVLMQPSCRLVYVTEPGKGEIVKGKLPWPSTAVQFFCLLHRMKFSVYAGTFFYYTFSKTMYEAWKLLFGILPYDCKTVRIPRSGNSLDFL